MERGNVHPDGAANRHFAASAPLYPTILFIWISLAI